MNAAPWGDAELYELETADDPDFDLPFWRGLVQELRPRRMLELACGTGRLSVPMAAVGAGARDGFELVGIDSSETFLARARAVLADQPEGVRAAVRLERGDMRDFALEGAFDLIAIPFNALAYLYTAEDRLAALRTARRHLAPGGRLAFDLLAPRLDYLAEALHPFPPMRLDVDFELPEAGVARFMRTCVDRYEAGTQTLTSTFLYEIHRTGGVTERHVRDVRWHMYYPAELELLLTTAGLEPVARHGDWDGKPFDAASSRYVFVCAAT
jgi:SAM-dependent methyltransferase